MSCILFIITRTLELTTKTTIKARIMKHYQNLNLKLYLFKRLQNILFIIYCVLFRILPFVPRWFIL